MRRPLSPAADDERVALDVAFNVENLFRFYVWYFFNYVATGIISVRLSIHLLFRLMRAICNGDDAIHRHGLNFTGTLRCNRQCSASFGAGRST